MMSGQRAGRESGPHQRPERHHAWRMRQEQRPADREAMAARATASAGGRDVVSTDTATGRLDHAPVVGVRRQPALVGTKVVGSDATEWFSSGPVGWVAITPQMTAPITTAAPTIAGAAQRLVSRAGSCVRIKTLL
jgi:hypothetical protein